MRAINREKFPRGLGKSRSINFVKDSLQPATALQAIDWVGTRVRKANR